MFFTFDSGRFAAWHRLLSMITLWSVLVVAVGYFLVQVPEALQWAGPGLAVASCILLLGTMRQIQLIRRI